MKKIIAVLCAVAFVVVAADASAQEPKPYKEGQVVALSYIKIKPGKFDDYMAFLATTYKQLMEANKKAGLITGYAVYQATARNANDPDIILATTYANMAALDRIDEGEAVAAKVMGSNAAQNKGFIDRGVMREVLGGDLIRELVLK